ncbi:hypothetical protein B7P33_19010 [Sediminicola luteus]|uniref:HNH nuclease domain-containing protein n=2 Tax=Sediminicola luteus TaxID=319238 RepID=A0A2A4G1X8_9FLAO|nr:hypothetical protein B7P33_19010 [Sediminicola luteus]
MGMKGKWTAEQIAFLEANYTYIGDTELTVHFNAKWGGFTRKGIEKKRRLLKLKRNKKQLHQIRMRNRQRGVWTNNGSNRWENTEQYPIGHRYFCTSKKYVYIKTENGYEPYHRYLWEKHHGPIPDNHVVCFKEGADKEYFGVTDIQLVSRKEFIKTSTALP